MLNREKELAEICCLWSLLSEEDRQYLWRRVIQDAYIVTPEVVGELAVKQPPKFFDNN